MTTRILVPALFLFSMNQAWGQFTVYTTGNSELPSNDVKCVEGRTSGVSWIGTAQGLAKLQDNTWTIYNTFNSQIDADVASAVAAQTNGHVWVGTFNGLSKFTGTQWIEHTDSLDDFSVYKVVVDNTDRVVCNPYLAGIAVFNGIYWTAYNTLNSDLPTDDVRALAVANNGTIWIGTASGLASFDGNDWNVYTTQNSDLPGDNILALGTAADNSVWISTSYGVAHFDGGVDWDIYTTQNSDLPGDNVRAFAFDGGGGVWLGDNGEGLTRFNGSTWTNYNTDNSNLPTNYVWSIDLDASGALLVGLDGGFAKLGNPLGVETLAAQAGGLQIWPNPATDHLYMSAQAMWTGRTELTIANVQGQVVIGPLALEQGQEQFVDVHPLVQGQYFARLTSDQGTTVSKVMIVR